MNDVGNIPKVTVRREIEASAEELFDAWLDPASLAAWMRPGDIRRATATVDARVGGAFEIVMHGASETYPHRGVYREIDRPRRLVFTWNSRAALQNDSLVTVEFRPSGTMTEIVLTHEGLPNMEAVAAHNQGWSDILAKLADTGQEARASA